MPSNPVDGDAQSMHFGRVIRHINPVRLFFHLSWLPVIPSPWFQHRYTHSPPLLQGISYRPWSWLWLWHDGEEYDEYIRSGTISARLGKVLILYHYLFKSAVIRLLNPSLICSFHWPILLLICIVRYCYLRPMVPLIRYSITSSSKDSFAYVMTTNHFSAISCGSSRTLMCLSLKKWVGTFVFVSQL